jgi:SAM-dependent methyltransferase
LAEGGSLPFQDHCFDFTYAIRVTNQTGSKKYAIEMIEEMIRVTKPGGHILVEVCNADRLFQKQLVGVRLGRMDIESINNVAICSISGVLVMSLTGLNWLNFLPIKYIKFIASMDRWVGKKWPWSASRVYVFMRKNKP